MLDFSNPIPWTKLVFWRDKADVEVSGWAITEIDNPLKVVDFRLVKQSCGMAHTDMDDDGLIDFAEQMVDEGYTPAEFMRVWVHTHPNMSASPSGTDWDTFGRVFQGTDWGAMAILSKTEDKSCRIRFDSVLGPREMDIPIKIPTMADIMESAALGTITAEDFAEWGKEHDELVDVGYQYGTYSVGGRHDNAGRPSRCAGCQRDALCYTCKGCKKPFCNTQNCMPQWHCKSCKPQQKRSLWPPASGVTTIADSSGFLDEDPVVRVPAYTQTCDVGKPEKYKMKSGFKCFGCDKSTNTWLCQGECLHRFCSTCMQDDICDDCQLVADFGDAGPDAETPTLLETDDNGDEYERSVFDAYVTHVKREHPELTDDECISLATQIWDSQS